MSNVFWTALCSALMFISRHFSRQWHWDGSRIESPCKHQRTCLSILLLCAGRFSVSPGTYFIHSAGKIPHLEMSFRSLQVVIQFAWMNVQAMNYHRAAQSFSQMGRTEVGRRLLAFYWMKHVNFVFGPRIYPIGSIVIIHVNPSVCPSIGPSVFKYLGNRSLEFLKLCIKSGSLK